MMCAVVLAAMTAMVFPMMANAQSTTADSTCQGSTESYWVINPEVGSTFNWTITPGVTGIDWTILNNNDDTVQVQWILPATYTLQVIETSAQNCPGDPVQLSVTVVSTTTIADAGPDDQICGLTYTLAGNDPTAGEGTWTLVSGPGTANFVDPTAFNTQVTVSVQGVYVFQWTITNNPCPPSSDQVQITFYSAPTVADAGPDQTLCGLLTATMAGNTPAIGTGTWSQVSGPGTVTFTNASDPLTTATATVYGTYVLRWTTSNGVCPASTDDMTLILNQKPVTNGIWHN